MVLCFAPLAQGQFIVRSTLKVALYLHPQTTRLANKLVASAPVIKIFLHSISKCVLLSSFPTLNNTIRYFRLSSFCRNLTCQCFFMNKKGVVSNISVATEARQSQSINKYERPTP